VVQHGAVADAEAVVLMGGGALRATEGRDPLRIIEAAGTTAMSCCRGTHGGRRRVARKQAFLNLVARVAAGLAWFSRTDWQTEQHKVSIP
jgi:hypothetical protein